MSVPYLGPGGNSADGLLAGESDAARSGGPLNHRLGKHDGEDGVGGGCFEGWCNGLSDDDRWVCFPQRCSSGGRFRRGAWALEGLAATSDGSRTPEPRNEARLFIRRILGSALCGASELGAESA